jgi:hypothetical protein
MSKSTAVNSQRPHLADPFDDSPMYTWEFLIGDCILPSQLSNASYECSSGEQKLAERLIWTMLDDLQSSYRIAKGKDARYRVAAKRQRRLAALDWIYAPDNDEGLSFTMICDSLGISKPTLQNGIERSMFAWAHSNGVFPKLFGDPAETAMTTKNRTKVGARARTRVDERRESRNRRNKLKSDHIINCCIAA